MSITNRIEKLIKSKKLTKSSFATEIGVQRSSLAHFFSGRNKPSLDFFLKIKKKYPDVDLNWIISGQKIKNNVNEKTNTNEIESVIVFYKDGTFKKS
tara:strand:- start:502 stop:792 length:291 start_codon:yes stop_codon:yes gene_type:complete